MGPYCKFCDERCFSHVPANTPDYILKNLFDNVGSLTILATCKQGQEHDKKITGYCFDDCNALKNQYD